MKPYIFVTAGLMFAAGAWAQPVTAQKLLPNQSEIVFVSKQMGVPVEGRFKQFDARVAFDPSKLATSKVSFTVNIGSATLGVRETDAELPKPEWFNTSRFPQATFDSTGFKALGGGKFEVAGKLSIKGVSTPVVVPVNLAAGPAGVTWVNGSFPIKRLTFKIGENEWADTSMVADEVIVKFKLALTGVGKF